MIKTKFGIRKLTPIECFYAQGYPKYYQLPTDMSDARLYKQAGNTIVVPVLMEIFRNMNLKKKPETVFRIRQATKRGYIEVVRGEPSILHFQIVKRGAGEYRGAGKCRQR